MSKKFLKNRFNILLAAVISGSLLLSGLAGCGGSGTEAEETNDQDSTENDTDGPVNIQFDNTTFSLPSPYQMAYLVKSLNLDYNKDFLNPTKNASKYTNNFKKALNLGVYGADLGYLNIYEQTPDAINYFSVIKKLSEDLDLLAAFNAETINRIESNMGNKDSLMYILSNTYRTADAYLKDNERKDIGVLILAGGWIESTFILTQIALNNKSQQEVINRIGEQKNPLENLIKILSPFYNESNEYTELTEKLIDLAYEFDGIDINYTYEAPIIDKEKKLTIINSKSEVVMSDEQLQTINKKIGAIRNLITE